MGDELQEVEVKKIGVFSFAGFFAVASLLIGIFLTIFLISGISIAVSLYPQISFYVSKYFPSNILLAITVPSTFLVLGFVFGAVLALVYNLISRIGGIKIYS